jgi:pimeloyl-ACP methyl ester carboxylesterase
MKYFNGFALQGEEEFFKSMLPESDLTVSGFSYGSQRAFEYVYHTEERVDRLILLSPAFFQNEKKSFIKTQLRYYRADEKVYRKQFLKNVAYPSSVDLEKNLARGTVEELESLLTYVWSEDKFRELLDRGVSIEVFIGGKDKIVNTQESFDFFKKLTTTYLLKNEGHLLGAVN